MYIYIDKCIYIYIYIHVGYTTGTCIKLFVSLSRFNGPIASAQEVEPSAGASLVPSLRPRQSSAYPVVPGRPELQRKPHGWQVNDRATDKGPGCYHSEVHPGWFRTFYFCWIVIFPNLASVILDDHQPTGFLKTAHLLIGDGLLGNKIFDQGLRLKLSLGLGVRIWLFYILEWGCAG